MDWLQITQFEERQRAHREYLEEKEEYLADKEIYVEDYFDDGE
ncbi:MAG: hypothetical protein ACOX3W_00585 [Christensenellaceae bacterium]|jgi:hypothetical protein